MKEKVGVKTLVVLYRYLDLLNEKKRFLEETVGDIEQVERLDIYEDLIDERNTLYKLIQDLEDIKDKEVYYGKN